MMKKLVFLSGILIIAASASILEEDGIEFQSFKLKHGKAYKNQAEEIQRFTIFRQNLRNIEQHNAEFQKGLHSYTKAMNMFADLSPEEFKSMFIHQTKHRFNKTRIFALAQDTTAPDSIDWRQQNVVVPVKNQGIIGCSWGFSIVGSVESAYAIKTGDLVRLSEQQIIDCLDNSNYACTGGILDSILSYIETFGLESDYSGSDGSCAYDPDKVVTHISSYVSVPSDEEQLREAVGTAGPVSISINAEYLQFYASGIFDDVNCDASNINHGVLAVGYGKEAKEDFWIIKNSWGTEWGENGYFRLYRGQNICGVKEAGFYPIV